MSLRIVSLLALFSCTGPLPLPDAAAPPSKAPDCAACPARAAAAARPVDTVNAAMLALSGRVLGAEGAVAGASVAVSAASGEEDGFLAAALSGPGGEFSLSVPPGADYVLSAHHGQWGWSIQPAPAASQGAPVELLLQRQEKSSTGVLEDELGRPIAGGRVELYGRVGAGQAKAFVVALTDAEGRFELRVPPGSYAVVPRFEKQEAAATPFALPVAAGLALQLFREPASDSAPSPAELEFVRKHRRPLADGNASVWTEDWLKGVQVIGIGEQTHGAREAIAARFELAKALIKDHGFNVVALEAGYEATWALAEWTRGKPGDVRAALDRLGMWLWQTQETVDFATWLRAENARRGPGQTVELVGAYGYTYFPTKLDALRERLETSGGEARSRLLREVPEVTACEQLEPAFASGERWVRARQRDPVLALLLDSIRRCDLAVSTAQAGEPFAAEVCQRVLAMSKRGATGPSKLVLLAHNGHVARARVGRAQEDILGQYLARSLGERYRAVGVTVGNGSFNGSFFDPKRGYAKGRSSLKLDTIRAGSLESVLSTGGASFFLPTTSEGEPWPGPVRNTRNIGASHSPAFAEHYWSPVLLGNTYDAVVYVDHVEPVVERPWAQ